MSAQGTESSGANKLTPPATPHERKNPPVRYPKPRPEPVEAKKFGILLAVPTRGYVWHETAKALEPHNPQYIREKLSAANVRNKIVRDFLKTDADALVMCDDDVIPSPGFIDSMMACPYDIVGAAVPIAKMPAHPVFINAFDLKEDGRIMTTILPERGHKKIGAIGTGLILIHRRVLEDERLKKPFDQQFDADGCILVGQDLEFCRRAGECGYTIGVTMDALTDHYISLHANAIALAYGQIPKDELSGATPDV